MQRICAVCIVVAACGLVPQAIAGAEWHVSPGGNDSFPGTHDKPFATLERAQNATPVAVRCARIPAPAKATLINAAGMPASPFRTDECPLE